MATEKGYARDPNIGWRASDEDNWELRWPWSIRKYSKMAREDSQVKSVIQAVTQPIMRTPWRIEENGADPKIVQTIAEDLNLPVKGREGTDPLSRSPRRVSWSAHLKRALRWKLIYGHAYFEMVWDDATKTDDKLTHLRKLAPRHPDTIEEIKVARDGGLEFIRQFNIGGGLGKAPKIPVADLLVYRHDDDQDSWVGESMLRAAYKHWVLKDIYLRLEQIVLDRNGMGVAVMKLREGADDNEQADAEKIVNSVRSGAEGGAVLKSEESLSIEGVKGQLASPRAAIEYQDSQIARTALAHALNLDGGGGSYALAEVQMDLFFQSLNEIAQEMADVANQYLVREMVYKLTGNTNGPFPLIVFDRIESKRTYSAKDLADMKNAGLLFADPILESHIRRSGELPPQQPREEWESNASSNLHVLARMFEQYPDDIGTILNALKEPAT